MSKSRGKSGRLFILTLFEYWQRGEVRYVHACGTDERNNEMPTSDECKWIRTHAYVYVRTYVYDSKTASNIRLYEFIRCE